MATTPTTEPIEVDAIEVTPPPSRMTEEAFEAWALGCEGLRAEWVDGEVEVMSPVNLRHLEITEFLLRVLAEFVEARDLGVVHGPEFMTRFRAGGRLLRRVPDLWFVTRDRLALLRPTYLEGPPDLAIEVVSPESQARDWRQKYLEYQAAGVREYWVIDPSSQVVEMSRREGETFVAMVETEGRLMSTVLPGLFLRPAWLWQDPLPKVRAVLGELGV